MTDWKKHHADEAEKALSVEMVENVIDEQLCNLGRRGDDLARYGLSKIASYAAQVARAQALGFDPYLLRLSPDEADEQILRLAERAALSGKPVWLIAPESSP